MRSLGHYAYRWRGRIVLCAAVVAAAAAYGGASVFDKVQPFGFQDPGSESSEATEALKDASGERPSPDIVLLVEPRAGSGDTSLSAAITRTGRELATMPGVTRVVTPAKDSQLLSDDGGAGLVVGYLDADIDDIASTGETVEATFGDTSGLTAGGAAVTAYELNQTTEDDLRRIEIFAAPLLFLLLLLVFRGLVAAALPLALGALSIFTTLLLLRLLTEVMEIDVFTINIVTALGLGLAIDYSLFVVSRFREELESGSPTGLALRDTMGSTGRMVLFSGLTVAAALAALCFFPQRFLYSIGVGGAIVALTSAVVCLTVLPAVLALLGPRVNALAPRSLQRRPTSRRWYSFGRSVLRHPLTIALVVVTIMVAAGLPFLRVALTRADATVLPEQSNAFRVDAVVDDRFTGDPSSLVTIVLRQEGGEEGEQARAISSGRRELESTDGVVRVAGPLTVGQNVRRLDAQLSVDPFSDDALDAVDTARGIDWGTASLITGPPAELTDQRESLVDHLPLAIGAIVASTLLLLFALTRSAILPFVALAMNALTVSVAFGVLVLIFQDGRLEGLLDYNSQGALDTSMPILLFAVVFGLSTDYGVFLLQRISEERRGAKTEADALVIGLARSGRSITAAAALFAVAMGAFAFSDLVFIKEVAIGTAVAVLVDATLVRALLFPAVLGILGSRAWWGPKSLARPEATGEPS